MCSAAQGDKDGMMPLHWAADRGDLEMVPTLSMSLVVGVFSRFFFSIFFGVGDIDEKNPLYVGVKELLNHFCA